MKKNIIFLFVAFILYTILVLSGCENVQLLDDSDKIPARLSSPTDLIIENGIAKWNAVPNALGYRLLVGNTEFSCPSNKYDLLSLSELNNGQFYNIKVKAQGNGTALLDSDYTGFAPYLHTGSVRVAALAMNVNPEPNDYTVSYSFTDGLNDYYYLYLGAVEYVPIAYGQTVLYDGITPRSLTYTTSSTTQESVTNTTSQSITDTTSTTNKTTNTHKLDVKLTFEKIPLASVVDSFQYGWSTTKESGTTKSRSISTTDTWATFQSWSTTNTVAESYTIGNREEYAGWYRYTTFATCDTFAALIHDKVTGEYFYDFFTYARPHTFFSAIDYNNTNDYSNREVEQRFMFDESKLANLPPVMENRGQDTKIYDFSSRANNANFGEISIAATDRRVVFIGSPSKTFTMNIAIASRNTDVLIILSNISFTAAAGADGTQTETGRNGGNGRTAIEDRSPSNTNKHTSYVQSIGTCKITGGAGGNGANYFNIGTILFPKYSRGGVGGAGGIGIDTGKNDLYIDGSGNISITGGAGGIGGNGNNSDVLIIFPGGDGGKGRYGIYCGASSSFHDYNKQSPISVTLTGGNGGSAGSYALYGGDGGYPFTAKTFTQDTIIPVKLNGGKGGAGTITGTTIPNNQWEKLE